MKRKTTEKYDGLLPATISGLKLIHKSQIQKFLSGKIGKSSPELQAELNMKKTGGKSGEYIRDNI